MALQFSATAADGGEWTVTLRGNTGETEAHWAPERTAIVIVMGVHTNRCVLGRPFGIRQMVYLGQNAVLCRDLTDSYHRDRGGHFEGLEQFIQHIERYWSPTISSRSITGQAPFRFHEDTRPE